MMYSFFVWMSASDGKKVESKGNSYDESDTEYFWEVEANAHAITIIISPLLNENLDER